MSTWLCRRGLPDAPSAHCAAAQAVCLVQAMGDHDMCSKVANARSDSMSSHACISTPAAASPAAFILHLIWPYLFLGTHPPALLQQARGTGAPTSGCAAGHPADQALHRRRHRQALQGRAARRCAAVCRACRAVLPPLCWRPSANTCPPLFPAARAWNRSCCSRAAHAQCRSSSHPAHLPPTLTPAPTLQWWWMPIQSSPPSSCSSRACQMWRPTRGRSCRRGTKGQPRSCLSAATARQPAMQGGRPLCTAACAVEMDGLWAQQGLQHELATWKHPPSRIAVHGAAVQYCVCAIRPVPAQGKRCAAGLLPLLPPSPISQLLHLQHALPRLPALLLQLFPGSFGRCLASVVAQQGCVLPACMLVAQSGTASPAGPCSTPNPPLTPSAPTPVSLPVCRLLLRGAQVWGQCAGNHQRQVGQPLLRFHVRTQLLPDISLPRLATHARADVAQPVYTTAVGPPSQSCGTCRAPWVTAQHSAACQQELLLCQLLTSVCQHIPSQLQVGAPHLAAVGLPGRPHGAAQAAGKAARVPPGKRQLVPPKRSMYRLGAHFWLPPCAALLCVVVAFSGWRTRSK